MVGHWRKKFNLTTSESLWENQSFERNLKFLILSLNKKI